MRQRIITGAMSELKERGIKFTMDDLARRLGMSKRTLYENFTSKEDLIGFLLAETIAEIKVNREAIAKDDTLDIREKFKQMITVRSSLWNEISDHLAIDIKIAMPNQWQKLEGAMDELWEVIEDLLREGARTGCFRPVFFPAIRVMFKGAFSEFANYKFLLEHKVTMREMIDYMLDILMFGLVYKDNPCTSLDHIIPEYNPKLRKTRGGNKGEQKNHPMSSCTSFDSDNRLQ